MFFNIPLGCSRQWGHPFRDSQPRRDHPDGDERRSQPSPTESGKKAKETRRGRTDLVMEIAQYLI